MSVDEVFFDRVAHDLRGELSTMLAGVHYLLRFGRDLSPPTREMLERVSGAGERLTRMLAELDDAVWLLDTHKPLVLASLRFGDLVDEVMTRIEPTVKTRGIRLVLEQTDADAAAELVGDVDLLATALTSIVDLATLRAPSGTVHVTAETRDGAPIVRVRDEGEAVPKDVLARLFEPFVEREIVPRETHGRRKLRLGIGLPIARAIFEAHGGSLVVDPSDTGLTLRGVISLRKASEIPVEPEKARAASG
ncbi:sensor histidine kinase [Polyangium jinanense]|uniref:histidine kinase n=1 Tax=Polyangium jinanense TaxID=2829994 RepID=A0A9X3XBN2_9BACT|nr:HAMP domain-containing sensor histidine kinase [Polyangium jinanense]MDC3958660.1 HAMP domain-containing histidine kinase [Polyangium jinanense]MDC3987287.1 HAMP domain-containing histidine kinase [Polyangium jinanense]